MKRCTIDRKDVLLAGGPDRAEKMTLERLVEAGFDVTYRLSEHFDPLSNAYVYEQDEEPTVVTGLTRRQLQAISRNPESTGATSP